MSLPNFTTNLQSFQLQNRIAWRGLNTIPPLLTKNSSNDVIINGSLRQGLDYDVKNGYASTVPPFVDILVGGYLIIVQILSVFFNGLVLGISFWKRKHLKTSDMFVVWLAVSDIGHPLTAYPMVISSSFMHEWIYGDLGCQWNGFTSFFFGINSMMTLTTMSFNRYLHITHSDIARHNSRFIVISLLTLVLLSSLFWSMGPLLGWGRYGPEPFKTSCTLVWDDPDQSYVTLSFVLVLAVPVLVMAYSYGRILCLALRTRRRRFRWEHRHKIFHIWQKKEMRLVKITVLMCCSFVIFWTPYAVVAMIKSYAGHVYLSPEMSIVPCLAAKTSHVADPIIYCLLNKNFSRYIPRVSSRKRRSEGQTARSPTTQTIHLNAILLSTPESKIRST